MIVRSWNGAGEYDKEYHAVGVWGVYMTVISHCQINPCQGPRLRASLGPSTIPPHKNIVTIQKVVWTPALGGRLGFRLVSHSSM